jgi:TfoX/Sxy family transcriptional regulator of competence genes
MAYDANLAHRTRNALAGNPGVVEKKMFGGLGFILNGNMACGILDDKLMVRVAPDRLAEALQQPGAQPFNAYGRVMKGWVMVSPPGWQDDNDLENWIHNGVEYTLSLPPKTKKGN